MGYMTTSPPTFTIMTYNILIGGDSERIDQIEAVIRHVQPDVLGIEEANHPDDVQAMAERLQMHCLMGYSAGGFHVALLSKWPICSWVNHGRPIFQKGLIEAVIDLPGEPEPWHIFVGHLTADFYRGAKAERQREAEVQTILNCMRYPASLGRPHLLMGDFNALKPGETLQATTLIAQVVEYDEERKRRKALLKGQPNLGYVIPKALHPLMPLFRQIPKRRILAALANISANAIIPRFAMRRLMDAGYVDLLGESYSPTMIPPTCPLPNPAGRIDYIWSDASLSQRLIMCDVILDQLGCPVDTATDHRPVVATIQGIGRFAESTSKEEERVLAGTSV